MRWIALIFQLCQLLNLRVTDQEIERLKHQMAIAQTARMAYAKRWRKNCLQRRR